MRTATTLGLSLLFAGLAACAGSASESNDSTSDDVKSASSAVQMNDVSIMLPLAKTAAELENGYLKASTKGFDGAALLPQSLYTSATGFPATPPAHTPVGSDTGMTYSNLRAVAYRVDPCFAQIGPIASEAACDNQLRIVFQSLSFSGGTGAVDGAVHAFYQLTRPELVSLLDDIVAAREANGGAKDLGPVAVHPIVVEQGLLGAESKALAAAVSKHAGTKNLKRFTTFMSGNLQTVWHFNGFDVADGKTTPMEIPTLPKGTTSVTFFAGFGSKLSGGFTPETSSTDDMQLLGNFEKANAETKAAQKAAVDAAFAIENPTKHSPNTIDCASCHMTGPGKALTASRDLGLSLDKNPNAFVPDAKWIVPANMTQTTPVKPDGGINVHMFSYRGSDLMIGERVINESASVVAYVNATVRPQK